MVVTGPTVRQRGPYDMKAAGSNTKLKKKKKCQGDLMKPEPGQQKKMAKLPGPAHKHANVVCWVDQSVCLVPPLPELHSPSLAVKMPGQIQLRV